MEVHKCKIQGSKYTLASNTVHNKRKEKNKKTAIALTNKHQHIHLHITALCFFNTLFSMGAPKLLQLFALLLSLPFAPIPLLSVLLLHIIIALFNSPRRTGIPPRSFNRVCASGHSSLHSKPTHTADLLVKLINDSYRADKPIL